MPLGERSGDKESRFYGVETKFNDDMSLFLSHNISSASFDFVIATLVRIIAIETKFKLLLQGIDFFFFSLADLGICCRFFRVWIWKFVIELNLGFQ